MSDLLTQLIGYADQIETVVPAYTFDPADPPSSDEPGEPTQETPGATWRDWLPWRWIIGGISVLVLVAVLVGIATRSSDPEATRNDPVEDVRSDDEGPSAEDESPATEAEPATEADSAETSADAEQVTDDVEVSPEGAADAEQGDAVDSSGEVADQTAFPCDVAGEDDLTVAANSADDLTMDTTGFTLREPTPSMLGVTVIDAGAEPCFDLRAVHEAGDSALTTTEVMVTLLGEPNGRYDFSYVRLTSAVEVTAREGGVFKIRTEDVDKLTLWDGAPPDLPFLPPESSAMRVRETIVDGTGLELGFRADDDPTRTRIGGSPIIPSGLVGVGAVWDDVYGSTRYELVDVSDGIATIIGTSELGDSTTWINFEERLLSAYDGWVDVSSGGITQINHIVVNKPPCREVAMITTEHPFGALSLGSPSDSILERGECGFGDPTAEWDGVNCRAVSWGSFSLHFETVDGRETFVAWSYETDQGGNAKPGGPGIDMLELPPGVSLDMSIDDIAAVLGVESRPSADGRRASTEALEFRADATGLQTTTVAVPRLPDC